MDFFGRDERESIGEGKAQLGAEDRPGADTGAVLAKVALVDDFLNQFVIGLHEREVQA